MRFLEEFLEKVALERENPATRGKAAQWLHEHPHVINQVDGDNDSPLMLAATFGCVEGVCILLERGANIHATETALQHTALHMAAGHSETGSLEILKLLIRAGADVNACREFRDTPLMSAASGGCTENVRTLLAHGATASNIGYEWFTALHFAARTKDGLDIARLLLLVGADVNARTRTGLTPSMCAEQSGNIELQAMLEKLVSKRPMYERG